MIPLSFFAFAAVELHIATLVIAAENSRTFAFKGDNSAVKNTV